MASTDRRSLMRAAALTVLAAMAKPAVAQSAPGGVITRLPGDGNQIALTIDDSTDTAVVAAWSHPKLTLIGLPAVADQIRRNADFLRNTYGTDGAPFYRPPYGLHNADTDRVAADQGYTYAQLLEIIASRGLQAVTLSDAFGRV